MLESNLEYNMVFESATPDDDAGLSLLKSSIMSADFLEHGDISSEYK